MKLILFDSPTCKWIGRGKSCLILGIYDFPLFSPLSPELIDFQFLQAPSKLLPPRFSHNKNKKSSSLSLETLHINFAADHWTMEQNFSDFLQASSKLLPPLFSEKKKKKKKSSLLSVKFYTWTSPLIIQGWNHNRQLRWIYDTYSFVWWWLSDDNQ